MKEVQTISWCDNHEGKVAATVERTVSVDGGTPVLLDLCDNCNGIVATVVALMSNGVAAPIKKKNGPQKQELSTTCPECGFVSASRESLGQHVRTQHGKGLKDLA